MRDNIVRRAWRRLVKLRYLAIPIIVHGLFGLFSVLPYRVVFAGLVFFEGIGFGSRKIFKQSFMPLVLQRLTTRPDFRLASSFTRWFSLGQNKVLLDVGAYLECCEEFERRSTGIQSLHAASIWSRALFEIGRFHEARKVLSIYSLSTMAGDPAVLHLRSLLDLIDGDVDAGLEGLRIVEVYMRHLRAPHQNLAARVSQSYRPNKLDAASGDDGRLYNAYNYIGQRVIHVGEGQLNAGLFQLALAAQKRLGHKKPPISSALQNFLTEKGINLANSRIFPDEWFTQIGHQAILAVELQMRELGWWQGQALFIVEPAKVANRAYLKLFEKSGHLLIPGVNIPAPLAAEMVSLQRWFGLCFNAFEMLDGQVVPWWDAAALAMQEYGRREQPFPMREAFDRTLGDSEGARVNFSHTLARWGVKPTDWYVCLHMRDATHYGEIRGVGQTHRNSDIDNYLATIKYVTDRGGWVIKLGGPRSPKLPKMQHVFDYARSKDRSELMDLFLIRNARFFIGTTSGLTNVAVGLGVPCALVNCVTTDSQLWSNRVRFALKWIRRGDGTLVNQRQITTTPWRWRMFSAELLGRWDATLQQNESDEILETVKEVEALATDNMAEYLATIPGAGEVIEKWRRNLDFAHFYGDALPSAYVARKHPSFLDEGAESARDPLQAEASGVLLPAPRHGRA